MIYSKIYASASYAPQCEPAATYIAYSLQEERDILSMLADKGWHIHRIAYPGRFW